MEIVPFKIQILTIVVASIFLFYVSRLIVKGKLREEYSFIWIFSILLLLVFSFWRDGLEVIAHFLGVYYPPSLAFMGIIFLVLVYLLHLSVVVSKLQSQNKILVQEIALLKNKIESATGNPEK